jgi:hypothetical protein
MKSSDLCKVPVILIALGAALALAPPSKAQSEVAPDHFDGTDSWEAAAHRIVAGSKSQPQGTATQANRHKVGLRAALQLTDRRQAGTRSGHGTSTKRNRRKVIAQNSRQVVAMQ